MTNGCHARPFLRHDSVTSSQTADFFSDHSQPSHYTLARYCPLLESQGSLLLNIEVLILKSRIDLIKLDPKEMFLALEQAIKIANDYQLTFQIERINKEINNYLEEFKKMK